MRDMKNIKTEIRKQMSNVPGVKWNNDGLEYFVSKELYLMYFDGNLELATKLGSIAGKVKKQVISYIHKNVLSDLEAIYEVCKSGTHHNGRTVEWLESEGLTVINK